MSASSKPRRLNSARRPKLIDEKYAKAYLVYEGIHFARTHDIEDLIALIPTRMRPDLPTELQALLTLTLTSSSLEQVQAKVKVKAEEETLRSLL